MLSSTRIHVCMLVCCTQLCRMRTAPAVDMGWWSFVTWKRETGVLQKSMGWCLDRNLFLSELVVCRHKAREFVFPHLYGVWHVLCGCDACSVLCIHVDVEYSTVSSICHICEGENLKIFKFSWIVRIFIFLREILFKNDNWRNVTNNAIMNINNNNVISTTFIHSIIFVFSQRSSEGYQTAQMPAMYAYGGYMYGPTVSGYYDYSQPANYNQYSTATTSVSQASVCTALSGQPCPVVVQSHSRCRPAVSVSLSDITYTTSTVSLWYYWNWCVCSCTRCLHA